VPLQRGGETEKHAKSEESVWIGAIDCETNVGGKERGPNERPKEVLVCLVGWVFQRLAHKTPDGQEKVDVVAPNQKEKESKINRG